MADQTAAGALTEVTPPAPITFSKAQEIEAYRRVLLIRPFEEKVRPDLRHKPHRRSRVSL